MSVTTKKTGNGGLCKLYTKHGKEMESIPWNVYPRPKMKRDSFYNLNGQWLLEAWDEKKSYTKYNILVPFCPESLLSGAPDRELSYSGRPSSGEPGDTCPHRR